MFQFHATTVEAYLGEFAIFTVHFDDGQDRYLQLRAPEQLEDPREFEPGYGSVEVEVNDQFYSGYNCFSTAELARDRFHLIFARDDSLVRQFGEVLVTFELDDADFADLRSGLAHVFRDFTGFVMDSPKNS